MMKRKKDVHRLDKHTHAKGKEHVVVMEKAEFDGNNACGW